MNNRGLLTFTLFNQYLSSHSASDITGTQNRNAEQNKLYAKDRYDLTCYYTNARSVFNKLTEVKHLVRQNNLNIIGITETWVSEEMTDAELHLEHFDLYRRDRIGRIGGGVMLYIHESLISIPCLELEHNDFEDSVWSIIKLESGAKLLVGTIYRSTGSNDTNNENLLKVMDKASNVQGVDYVL